MDGPNDGDICYNYNDVLTIHRGRARDVANGDRGKKTATTTITIVTTTTLSLFVCLFLLFLC